MERGQGDGGGEEEEREKGGGEGIRNKLRSTETRVKCVHDNMYKW